MKDIKDYRNNELKNYVIGNILLVLLLSGIFNELLSKELGDIIDIINLVIQSTLLSSIIYIYVFLFDSIIPGKTKQMIAYGGLGNLPGYTIFSDMKKKLKDDRFTSEDVMIKYKSIYDQMPLDKKAKENYENAHWYRLYQKYQDKNKVYTANRDFLLCRDITIITLFLIGMYMAGVFLLNIFEFSIKIVAIMICELVIADIAMRGKASRLAYNVIAEDIYSNDR
jgi:hypothetical protein